MKNSWAVRTSFTCRSTRIRKPTWGRPSSTWPLPSSCLNSTRRSTVTSGPTLVHLKFARSPLPGSRASSVSVRHSRNLTKVYQTNCPNQTFRRSTRRTFSSRSSPLLPSRSGGFRRRSVIPLEQRTCPLQSSFRSPISCSPSTKSGRRFRTWSGRKWVWIRAKVLTVRTTSTQSNSKTCARKCSWTRSKTCWLQMEVEEEEDAAV